MEGSAIKNEFDPTGDPNTVLNGSTEYSVNSYAEGIYTLTENTSDDAKKTYTFDEEGNFISYSSGQKEWIAQGRIDGGNLYYNPSTGEYCQLYTNQDPNEIPPENTFI